MDRHLRSILADTPAGRAYLARIDREKAAALRSLVNESAEDHKDKGGES